RAAAGVGAPARRSRAHRSRTGARHAHPVARRRGPLLPGARDPAMSETDSAANESAAAPFTWFRRRLASGKRRAADGAVRLPIVMRCGVALFAATVARVWFGYGPPGEGRSGTNLLVERRANEALALVRAALTADMKGAWITAIVPFNATDLEEDPPYSMFQ